MNAGLSQAMAGAVCASIGCAPLGVFLVQRRMSLMGDVMAHAILPGVAVAFILYGLSLPAMSVGGFVAGLCVALAAGAATRVTALREDASLAAFYLIAVAAGVVLIALHGNAQDLEDILFGDAKSLSLNTLVAMGSVSFITLLVLTLIYRPLVVESFDPVFLRSVRGKGGFVHAVFIVLTVLNMVENYRAVGTLMAAGLMLLPAITAQFWTQRLLTMMIVAVGFGMTGAALGLGCAFSYALPPGPAIILVLGVFYIFSLAFGRFGSIRVRYFPFHHLEH